jgi:hypothetical protein
MRKKTFLLRHPLDHLRGKGKRGKGKEEIKTKEEHGTMGKGPITINMEKAKERNGAKKRAGMVGVGGKEKAGMVGVGGKEKSGMVGIGGKEKAGMVGIGGKEKREVNNGGREKSRDARTEKTGRRREEKEEVGMEVIKKVGMGEEKQNLLQLGDN